MADLVVDGVRFNVVRLSPGGDASPTPARAPVVFLHGLIMDNLSSFYYTLAPAVAATTETVLYDLRGHGRSERPLLGYRIEDSVDDLFGILDELGIVEPVHLVTNSFGGTIALAAGLWRPERVAGLALIEAHPAFEGWGEEIGDDLYDLVEGLDDPRVRDYLRSDAPRTLRRMVNTCEELVIQSSLRKDLRESQPTTPEDLTALRCPTLLLYGSGSDIFDRALVLHDAIPGSTLEIVEDCSHALLMENPHEVERRVLAWLDARAASEPVAATRPAP